MSSSPDGMAGLKPYDLSALAANGLRRGRTTGSCAAAAVKAALIRLLTGESPAAVSVTLPDLEHYLEVPIEKVSLVALDDITGGAVAEVVKFAGDDPDQTDGAVIFADVRSNDSDQIRFFAGSGVGTVTAPGIRVAVGEPAINPAPREMIRIAVQEVLADLDKPDMGFDIIIGCVDGEKIATRTFNPRLGIVGGISILGTTGIVEPMSLAAYKAAIEVYIRVALAAGAEDNGKAAFLPGNLGLGLAKEELGLDSRRIVHISNFIGFAFEATQAILEEEGRRFPEIWLLGHPGKIAKILDGHWDTHSQKSPMALAALARVAAEIGLPEPVCATVAAANTAEALVESLDQSDQDALWTEISRRAASAVHNLVPRVEAVHVQLFNMSGAKLGRHNSCR